jgi:hypothetical protein
MLADGQIDNVFRVLKIGSCIRTPLAMTDQSLSPSAFCNCWHQGIPVRDAELQAGRIGVT